MHIAKLTASGEQLALPPRGAPIKLPPAVYDDWLEETKEVVAGPPLLRTRETNPDYLAFDAHTFTSDVLPQHYADHLFIVGAWNRFTGLCVTATVKGFDYLLMGHIRHNGEFVDCDGVSRPDKHPHFHELDYYAQPTAGHPATKRRVSEDLCLGMPPADFLDAFAEYYRFTPLGSTINNVVQEVRQSRPAPVQYDLESAFRGRPGRNNPSGGS